MLRGEVCRDARITESTSRVIFFVLLENTPRILADLSSVLKKPQTRPERLDDLFRLKPPNPFFLFRTHDAMLRLRTRNELFYSTGLDPEPSSEEELGRGGEMGYNLGSKLSTGRRDRESFLCPEFTIDVGIVPPNITTCLGAQLQAALLLWMCLMPLYRRQMNGTDRSNCLAHVTVSGSAAVIP